MIFKPFLDVKLEGETVWLNRQQLAELFDRDVKTIGKHINNALKEELNDGIPTVAKFATVQKEGTRTVNREIEYYNLDMIISVGYRVKSRRGVEFRRWANSVLKQYLIKGYAVNERIRKQQISELRQLVQVLGRTLQQKMNKIPSTLAPSLLLSAIKSTVPTRPFPLTSNTVRPVSCKMPVKPFSM